MDKEEKISFIMLFNEVDKKQANDLWLCLLNSNINWHVLKANDDLIEDNKLKQALNEIRKYIKENCIKIDGKYTELVCTGDELLQIIAKALGGDNSE